MIKDRVLFDLPAYDGLLAGHYERGAGYARRRPGGTDDWLLVMTLSGRGRFGTDRDDLVADAPGLVLIAPGTTHDYGTHRDAVGWEILWVHFHPPAPWLELLRWPEVHRGVFELCPSEPDAIQAAFREVVRTSQMGTRRRRQFAMNSLEKLLLLCDLQAPIGPNAMDSRVQACVEHIHSHLAAPLTLGELAKRAGLSSSRFSHLFREEMRIAPRQYILQQRLLKGRVLLERTNLGVAEVAAEVGMDPFPFSMRFREEFGQSPREFRRVLE